MTTKQPAVWESEYQSLIASLFTDMSGTDDADEIRYFIKYVETAAVQRGVTLALEAILKENSNPTVPWDHGYNHALTQSRENITNLLTKIA